MAGTTCGSLKAPHCGLLPVRIRNGRTSRKRSPTRARACWSGNVADGPEPLVALAGAVARRDWALAKRIGERMAWAQAPMFPGGKLENFVDYNIPIAHARLEGSGLVQSGPPRPPYTHAPGGLHGGRPGRRAGAGRA